MRHLPLLLLAACGLTESDLEDAIAEHAADESAHHDKTPDGVDQAAVDATIGDAITDHAADASAHHTKTTSASELTSGTLDPALLPELTVMDMPLRERSLSINLYGALLDNATFGGGGFGNSGIRLPDAGVPDFRFQFTVPDDFVGTELTLRVGWRINATGCSVQLTPNSIDRWRPGSPIATGSSTSGLTGPLATMTAPATARAGALAEYTIGPGGGYTDILPGDGLAISLYRATSAAGDTCAADLLVTSLSVVYDAQ